MSSSVSLASSSASAEVVGVEVRVFDWWKVRALKEAYSTVITDSLGPSDQLYLEVAAGAAPAGGAMGTGVYTDDLDDMDKLYKYSIRPDTVLRVKREDFTAPTCYYICADCGNDVKLKPRDAVRCRECGHRIVFKKRIAKPCQYLCR